MNILIIEGAATPNPPVALLFQISWHRRRVGEPQRSGPSAIRSSLLPNVIPKILALIFAVFSVAGLCLAQEQSVPTGHILPEDILQDSIWLVRTSTNRFTVGWTYTEAGAKKMLAFWEAHEGQKMRTVIGSFESPPSEFIFSPMPPVFTNYAQWKEGWLKRRTDKYFGMSEENATKIVAGLKSK